MLSLEEIMRIQEVKCSDGTVRIQLIECLDVTVGPQEVECPDGTVKIRRSNVLIGL